ncbi:type III pantothenate kinase [Paratractidigestivibacter sp.]|uniref:type III pantothenate kinase n=1 Tax=Paratractidigestivibacter sp. TaxID=2847316 RepID=UPI002ABE05E0|nr:type III pantothenate kinase [Paratractidigestivibacter sp.]
MFLAIDVGNTQTTLGLFDDEGGLVRGWRMVSDAAQTSDMLHARLWTYFAKDGVELAEVTDAGVASVVPPLQRAWWVCLRELLGHEPLRIDASTDYGMPIDMPDPSTVGADRIANAIAAVETYGAPVIVVDFGTATNIDVVDQRGAYRGGAISPGLMLSANALFSKAAKLASIPVVAPEHALGNSTETAMQSGLVIGAAAQAEGLVARMKAELGAPDATVVGTGGLARTVSQATDLFDTVDPDLTLRGIRQIWLRQR